MKSCYDRETVLKAIRFEKPDFIPMQFVYNPSCWNAYPQEALMDLMESHPFLFPGFERTPLPYKPCLSNVQKKDCPYTDDFGCVWETTVDGITGTVTGHPLDDWSKFAAYRMPDPEVSMGIGSIDWNAEVQRIRSARRAGNFTVGGLRHGHTFLQVCDIRGYENVLYDMLDEEPDFDQLLDGIVEFNLHIIRRYLEMDVDMMEYPEDLGMQHGPMLAPEQFRKYFLPRYREMVRPAREKGTIIHMHSDGDIRTLMPALMEAGIDVFNLQDLVNGIGWIKENLKGKVCIDLDIDRQKITTFGSPEDVDRLILEEIKELGSKQGGLTMVYGMYPGVPLENAKALMDAMEKYAFYYA